MENNMQIAIKTPAGPLVGLETLIRGTVKVHGSLLIQAFLAPVYKKGKISLITASLDDVDGILETCIGDKRFQEAKSRVLAFRITSTEKNMVRSSQLKSG